MFTAPSKDGVSFETHFLIVELLPEGIQALFGLAAHELTNRVVEADHIFGNEAVSLRDRIGEAVGRRERFSAMIDFLRHERDRRSRPVSIAALWAIDHTLKCRGDVRIAALCDELEMSRKHLNTLYLESVGLSPKMFARLTRFHALLDSLDHPGNESWVNRAINAGYFDQAHMHRDFAEFTGETPAGFLSVRTEDGSVVYDDARNPLT